MDTPTGVCSDCAQRRRGFLSHLDPRMLSETMCVMRKRRLSAGTVLGRRDELPEGVFSIQEGLVKLVAPGPREHPRIVDLLGPGDLVGLAGVFGRRLTCDAVAVTELGACFAPAASFRSLLASNAAVATGLANHLSSVIDREAERLRGLGTNTAVERVAGFLVDGKLPRSGTNTLLVPLRRRDLAALLGIAPETTARALTRLQEEGILQVQGRRITILDTDRLISRAGG